MLIAKYDAKTAQLAVELAAAKAANVAAFELANTLRAQHAKEVARHSAELAKVLNSDDAPILILVPP